MKFIGTFIGREYRQAYCRRWKCRNYWSGILLISMCRNMKRLLQSGSSILGLRCQSRLKLDFRPHISLAYLPFWITFEVIVNVIHLHIVNPIIFCCNGIDTIFQIANNKNRSIFSLSSAKSDQRKIIFEFLLFGFVLLRLFGPLFDVHYNSAVKNWPC